MWRFLSNLFLPTIAKNQLFVMLAPMNTNNFTQQLHEVTNQFFTQLETAQTDQQIETMRVTYLGRNGIIATLMDQIKQMNADDKRAYGPLVNTFKRDAQEKIDQKKGFLQAQLVEQKESQARYFDVTAYNPHQMRGSLHPYTPLIEQIENIFISMGYEIADGPEVETEYHNFEALNIPKNHPARDMQDTFWLNIPQMLLRTHTSSVQVRTMEYKKPPLAILAAGRCYRHEATDATHDFMFMQTEGLFIDKKVSMANLLATLKTFFGAIFNRNDLEIRVRPAYFPFVEPGIEIDISCPFCTQGCSLCKHTGWIEMGGAGLVHPHVLRSSHIDPEQYSGFAFGFGLTRLAMLTYGINDIRLLQSNKLDFLNQF